MSMKCVCGAQGFCIDSRPGTKPQETRRRYMCGKKKCGKRWTTYEMVSPARQHGTSMMAFKQAVGGKVAKEVIADIEKRVNDALKPYKGKRRG